MRLIDANKVVREILAERDKIPRTVPAATYELVSEKPFKHGNSMRGGIRKALRCIEHAPTVDAVAVTRCRECKYYCQDKINGEICRHPELDFDIECYDHWINTKPDDFCSYGERKECADNG